METSQLDPLSESWNSAPIESSPKAFPRTEHLSGCQRWHMDAITRRTPGDSWCSGRPSERWKVVGPQPGRHLPELVRRWGNSNLYFPMHDGI